MIDFTECIEPKEFEGRPQTTVNGKKFYTSRIVASLFHGLDLQDTLTHVCHTCDNPKCINPLHLFLGTAADNIKDCSKKGRMKNRGQGRTGEHNIKAKLTNEQVVEIKLYFKNNGFKYGDCEKLARQYKVSRATISGIRKGRFWAHILV